MTTCRRPGPRPRARVACGHRCRRFAQVARVADVAAEEAGGLLQRSLCRRQPDPLRRLVGDLLQPFEGERQVGSALGGGHGVDLVDDHGLDPLQRLARRRGEHEIERLGRGDQQVGRATDQPLAFIRLGVAGAHRHLWRGERDADPLGRQPDARQGRPEVLLDVERQRPQRRDVEHSRAVGARLGRGVVTSRSIEARNAASVLPDPVGAQIRVCSPATMCGHPSI